MPPILSTRRLPRTFARTATASSVTCALPWPAGLFGVFHSRECYGRTENDVDSCREQGVNPYHGWHDGMSQTEGLTDSQHEMMIYGLHWRGAVIPGGLSSTYI